MPASSLITIFGGTGFIGRQLLRSLSKTPFADNLRVRVASRTPPSTATLNHLVPSLPKLSTVKCDIRDLDQTAAALRDATHVVNCVGILFETPSRGVTFRATQHEGPASISAAVAKCDDQRVPRVVHLSAIGANESSGSAYARTKAAGEREIMRLAEKDRAHVTVLRPSIVFGPEDSFFNRFDSLAKYLPFLPLVGGGTTKFQPVHVADVAEAIIKTLGFDEKADSERPSGIVYELGGRNVLSFKQLMELTIEVSRRRRLLLPIPYPVASLQGALFEAVHQIVPSMPPMLTRDQVELLKSDNVVSAGAKTLADLGIEPMECNANTISYLR